jgi:hypothetical protein
MLQYIDPNVDDENFYTEGNTSLVRIDLNLVLLIILCYINKRRFKCDCWRTVQRKVSPVLNVMVFWGVVLFIQEPLVWEKILLHFAVKVTSS